MARTKKSITADPRPPVVMPGDEKIIQTPVKPPSQRKPKRKPRSDKGKKRLPKDTPKVDTKEKEPKVTGLSKEAAHLKKLYVAFDTYKKSANWSMEVWPCWNNFDKYEIKFVFDGVRYGYKQTFKDASMAVAIGMQYLDHRYQNKSLY